MRYSSAHRSSTFESKICTISTSGEVESTDGHIIPGLFAAGELVGGLFYHNYPGGTGLVSGAVLARWQATAPASTFRERTKMTLLPSRSPRRGGALVLRGRRVMSCTDAAAHDPPSPYDGDTSPWRYPPREENEKETADDQPHRRHALALGSGTLLVPSLSRAQAAWPAGPVTFVVGYARAAARISMPRNSETS